MQNIWEIVFIIHLNIFSILEDVLSNEKETHCNKTG